MPNESGRLRKVNDLLNQFVSSITHKPLDTKTDQARIRAFISSLRKLLTGVGVSVKPTPVVEKTIKLTDEERKEVMIQGTEQVKQIKKTLGREQ